MLIFKFKGDEVYFEGTVSNYLNNSQDQTHTCQEWGGGQTYIHRFTWVSL